ncbi:hypothetical protein BAS10_14465 [Elizabethkingia meningoseptica]|uniref:DUF445 domain-containing protein n=1 Tax=Elizabethkingia meningoseptica TaxID=238 RepID=UPI00099A00BC|nr:DUF445 domain-containing protein [Elizabethkingia meningoseptica]OPC04280.1 hypothetical protein BAS10_14465 [Elizabethkingia meningoseptica]
MTEAQKRKQLFRYKALATGLFLLMACIFVATTILQKSHNSHWIGYIHAFSEAAMVGALADWFAVTALFHYPLGMKIPHTNLIENSKQKIGDNLGNFVVENFASAENIRPYIEKIKVSGFVSDWLLKDKNQDILVTEVALLLKNAISQFQDQDIINFISVKIKEAGHDMKINNILSNGIFYLLEKNEHQAIITFLSSKIKHYILENDEMIRDKVHQNSYSLVPKFVDNKIANKIISGLAGFFEDIETTSDHAVRNEISNSIYQFAHELKTSDRWENELNKIKQSILTEEKLNDYATDIWTSLKKTLTAELEGENSKLKVYAQENIRQFAEDLNKNEEQQNKIDQWIRFNLYRLVLKNTGRVSELISTTVGNWEGKELSQKLELEVGKDLQFIRINGTVVGGLVGLIIYTLASVL